MEIAESIYALPQTLELGESEETIYPVAAETKKGLLLVDVGLPGNADRLDEELSTHGFSLEDIEKILLTHQDFDHCGCLAEVVERTGATVMAHEDDAPAIDGREDPIKGDERYPAAEVDVELSGGESIRTEAGDLEVVNTPGHTSGHVSVHVGDLLISGDALNLEEEGLAGPRDRFTPDMEEAARSVYRLSFLDFSQVHCFHGGTVEHGPEKVSEIFDSLSHEVQSYRLSSGEGDRFLRRELPNDSVGLSRFRLEAGESHGAKENDQTSHRHSEQTEIYFFQSGTGTIDIDGEEVEVSAGDAIIVAPSAYRRIEAEEDLEFVVAGAPVGDETEAAVLD